ncbi:MAG: hypothetical protein J3K34DRAFT_424549 [Monoraphidium minutum]|nr:MAG: hypothetical protein J3K34DRAFT_424549 [Monoraphidium minutum]
MEPYIVRESHHTGGLTISGGWEGCAGSRECARAAAARARFLAERVVGGLPGQVSGVGGTNTQAKRERGTPARNGLGGTVGRGPGVCLGALSLLLLTLKPARGGWKAGAGAGRTGGAPAAAQGPTESHGNQTELHLIEAKGLRPGLGKESGMCGGWQRLEKRGAGGAGLHACAQAPSAAASAGGPP